MYSTCTAYFNDSCGEKDGKFRNKNVSTGTEFMNTFWVNYMSVYNKTSVGKYVTPDILMSFLWFVLRMKWNGIDIPTRSYRVLKGLKPTLSFTSQRLETLFIRSLMIVYLCSRTLSENVTNKHTFSCTIFSCPSLDIFLYPVK